VFPRYLEPAPVELGDLDAVLLSHAHNDHLDDTAKQRLSKSVRMILPPTAVEPMRAAGFDNLVVLDWGEATKLVRGKATLEITAVPAHHAHDAALDTQIGRGNGWVLRFSDPQGSYVLYVSGDAVLAPEMATANKVYGPIDLFVPHLGGVAIDKPGAQRTMTAAEALTAFEQMGAKMMLPIHHTTFGHYREPIEVLRERALEAKVDRRVVIVPVGEKTPFPSAS
jgi:L-ascorbate metabolism protein UlaG (beta-lactamase superfamily)